jgi:hypothetical protein
LALPTASEARLVAVETPLTDLLVGDQVGPEDVTLPIDYTVVGVLERSREQRRMAADIPLRIRTPAGAERTRVRPTVFVRRYEAVVTILRADQTVDTVTTLWRPVGIGVAPVEPSALRLRPGDTITLSAP